MKSPFRRRAYVLLLLAAFGFACYLFQEARVGQTESGAFLSPRYPAYLTREPSQDEKQMLIRRAVRQLGGWTRLGLAKPGERVLIMGSEGQDMELVDALLQALRTTRGVEAHYISLSQIIKEMLHMSEEEQKQLFSGGSLYGAERVKDGWREAIRWPRYLPANLREQLNKESRVNMKAWEVGRQVARNQMRRYLEAHPEYDALFGGTAGTAGRQVNLQMDIGPKWRSEFEYSSWESLRDRTPTFPNDLWRLLEDKVMALLPWVEEVRITDPQGTDMRFKLTADQAAMWAKAAYLPNHIYMYPLQGTRDLYLREGIRGHIVPDTNGVLAGTANHSGYHPLIKLYIKHGLLDRIEGGGRYGEIWRKVLENEELKTIQYPYLPHPGMFYLFECSVATNPKGAIRSGQFHWGFGMESTTPEVNQYAKKRNLPNDHGFHVQTYFTTYEVKIRGADNWLKMVDNGHLVALEDAEVKALATRYGDVGKLLREDRVPAIPGVNVPGDQWKSFAADPVPYFSREAKEIAEGTYKYLE
ncbi:MAG: hypothetical protein HY315_00945 [Acidobacteria bacterium]|nr:hypothetical protein [Acidobacteriota bacterium]